VTSLVRQVRPNGLEVAVNDDVDDVTVLVVSGEIDTLTAPMLMRRILAELSRKPARLIIDLTRVDFLASAGINALMGAHYAAGRYTEVAIVADGPATSRPLRLIGIDEVIALYTTLDQAMTEPRPDTCRPGIAGGATITRGRTAHLDKQTGGEADIRSPGPTAAIESSTELCQPSRVNVAISGAFHRR
jgi:anti-sigma B factor antagonist